MLELTIWNWILGVSLLLTSTTLLVLGLLRLTSARRQKPWSLERQWSVIQSWFHADNGGTATTATVAALLLGEPVSARRLLIYSGTISLITLVANSLLSRWRREAMIRRQVARVSMPTSALGKGSSDLQKLFTSIAALAESVNSLKLEAGKNTPTERSTRTSRLSQPKKSQPTTSSVNGQRELHEFAPPPGEEQIN